jgi:hypothetical protein
MKLSHWNFPDKHQTTAGRDTYTADIQNFRILIPAPILESPSSSRKRKVPSTDPGSPTKTKKKRI